MNEVHTMYCKINKNKKQKKWLDMQSYVVVVVCSPNICRTWLGLDAVDAEICDFVVNKFIYIHIDWI